MSRNPKPPFIPPLKLSASEDAVLRGRPQKVRHAPDDLPDPQAGGESARRQRNEDSAADKEKEPTAPSQPAELDAPKTAETEEDVAADHTDAGQLEQPPTHGDENVKEPTSKTTSRVRKLIRLFDRSTCTNVRTKNLLQRHTNNLDLGETAKLSKDKNNASGGKITPCDDSDVDSNLPDAGDNTDGSVSALVPRGEEETNQNTRTDTKRLRRTEESKMSKEPRQPSVKITHHRNRGLGPKSRLSLPREPMSASNASTNDACSFTPNTGTLVRNVAPVDTCKVSKRSRLPVFRPETRILKDLTVREAFTGSKRASQVDYIPSQVPPTSSTKIRTRWDGSPPKRGASIGAHGESTRPNSRSRPCTKLITDVANPPSDEATELSCTEQKPEGQDPVANFVLHDPALQPPCRPTNRLVFEPSERTSGVESHLSQRHFSAWSSIITKLKYGLSYFLSLVMVAASWIVYPLCSPVLPCMQDPGNLCQCPLPSSPGQLSQACPENQNGIWNRFRTSLHGRRNLIIRGVILLTVFLCCLEFLVHDFCQN